MTTVLIPAVDSLLADCRTRVNNTSHTSLSTSILPKYVRIYGKDLDELDSALSHQIALSPFKGELSWYFLSVRLGQRHLLEPGKELEGDMKEEEK